MWRDFLFLSCEEKKAKRILFDGILIRYTVLVEMVWYINNGTIDNLS